jgi:hypothetical protein
LDRPASLLAGVISAGADLPQTPLVANWTVPESVDLVLFARRGLATAWAALALWLVAAFAIFYNFPDAPAAGTDAVIMLGGASNERLPVADQLQDHVDVHGSTPDLNLKQWVDRFVVETGAC